MYNNSLFFSNSKKKIRSAKTEVLNIIKTRLKTSKCIREMYSKYFTVADHIIDNSKELHKKIIYGVKVFRF